jgi:hypothetical protein
LDYQSRVQAQREREFESYLLKSVYRIDFIFGEEECPGIFERYKQDETETLHYLLTRRDLDMPSGTIIMIKNKNGIEVPWLVYWLEEIAASGYNKYIMLKLTHFIKWTARDGQKYSTWAYMYGQEDNMLKDELKSRSRSRVLYNENLKLSFFIMPTNTKLRKDDYFTVGEGELEEGYKVTGYDIQSTPGVEYVTVDPVYLYDTSETPIQTEEDEPSDFYWIGGK